MARIALIEDDLPIVEAYKAMFGKTKHELMIATDGESGLELIKRERPDLILLDILLPQKSGFDIAKELKADPEFKDTKIIILTNLPNMTASTHQLEQLGIPDYLVKSQVNHEQVLETVNRVLKS